MLDGGWTKWVMGITEDTCWDECWVLYGSDESLGSTPEASTTLYVYMLMNLILNK